jgi:hypothetical protein
MESRVAMPMRRIVSGQRTQQIPAGRDARPKSRGGFQETGVASRRVGSVGAFQFPQAAMNVIGRGNHQKCVLDPTVGLDHARGAAVGRDPRGSHQ